jgi:hypothetical protein
MLGKESPGRGQPTGGNSHNANSSNIGPGINTGDDERFTLDEMLDCLGWQHGEYTAVCHKAVGGQFAFSVAESANAAARVESLPPQSNTWFSVNPTAGPARVGGRRGGNREVTRWAALVLDVDVEEGAFPDLDKAFEFVNAVSSMVGTRPSVVIHSGHGLQPLWPIEDCVLDAEEKWARAYALSRRFGRFAHRVANDFSASLDTVSDLARIIRVPETTNWKDPANPVRAYALRDTGGPLTVDQVEEFVDEWAPEIGSDAPVEGDVVSPVDSWKLGSSTCFYAAKMVSAWRDESDRPQTGRHQWAMSRALRLAAASRLGCITEDDLNLALGALESALEHWCQVEAEPRDLAPDEVGSAYRWALRKVATFSDERSWQEMPDHPPHWASWQAAGTGHGSFWELTDTLQHVRDFARARRVSPWALLGVTLARLLTTIPPSVQLPPLVGGRASLNLFIGLVGDSGKGKGAPERAAGDAFKIAPIYVTGIGSGEGINHLFAHYDKNHGTVMDRRCVLFSVPEIDMLAALGQRNASTLLPQLRKAWSGEALSFAYVSKDKALVIQEHDYRLNLVAGIQPGRAGALLDDSDGGTPQRFVWLPCTDLDAPEQRPPEPEPIDLTAIADGWPPCIGVDLAGRSGPHEMVLPHKATELVDRSRLAALRGEDAGSALDGHALLCRIKVAVGLAFLHQEREVTDEFWEMSGVVMEVSSETRRGVEAGLAERAEKQNRARGRAEGVRAVEADTVREEEAIKRVGKTILRRLDKQRGSASRSAVREAVAFRDREPYFDPALDMLLSDGRVEVVPGERGELIRRRVSR